MGPYRTHGTAGPVGGGPGDRQEQDTGTLGAAPCRVVSLHTGHNRTVRVTDERMAESEREAERGV